EVAVPPKIDILYGTAWKEDDTERLVRRAIEVGFRGIDTACQPKHYNEAGVGGARGQRTGQAARDQQLLPARADRGAVRRGPHPACGTAEPFPRRDRLRSRAARLLHATAHRLPELLDPDRQSAASGARHGQGPGAPVPA